MYRTQNSLKEVLISISPTKNIRQEVQSKKTSEEGIFIDNNF